MQGPSSGRNSFITAVRHLGIDAIPPPSSHTLSILPLLHSPHNNNESPSSPSIQSLGNFIGFNPLSGGLNNQLLELAGIISIANALGRSLVLPNFYSGDFVGNDHVVKAEELFDIEALKANLAG